MKKFLLSFLPLIILSSGCQVISNQKVIRLGHGLASSHTVHIAMVYFGEELERISNGKLKLKIYPSEQLGSERQCIELLQIGSLDMTKVNAAVLENFSPSMKVFGIPYVFRDKEHVFNVLAVLLFDSF